MRTKKPLTAILIGIWVLVGPMAASAQEPEPVEEAQPEVQSDTTADEIGEEKGQESPEGEKADESDEDATEKPEATDSGAQTEQTPATQPTQDPEDVEEPADVDESHGDEPEYGPALPVGMSLDDVLDIAQKPPPRDFPRTIPDDRFFVFLLAEQLEYRMEDVSGEGELGWHLQAWAGGDFNKIWLKNEGEANLLDPQGVGSETDLLYSRLVTTFWNLQAGVQYANEWSSDSYEDRWSGAVALQGMAPGSFEVDASFYFSDALDVTASLGVEYDVRITQRLVLQPSTEISFAAQEVPERGLGVGLTGFDLDARLRYEFFRKFAPYLGVRYSQSTFGTADFARDAGDSPSSFMVIAGLRFAI